MTTFSADFSPLYDTAVHMDCTLVKQDSERSTFVYFLFVQYDTKKPETIALFGANHDCVSIRNGFVNKARVLDECLNAATMRSGDTDSDFFDRYTAAELTWRDSDLCEALAGYYDQE